jgi:hypothetical protein
METTAQTKRNFIPAVLLLIGGFLLLRGGSPFGFELIPPKPDPNDWVVLVEEFEERDKPSNAAYVATINSPEFRAMLSEKNLNFRNWDVDQGEGKALADSLKLPVPFYAILDAEEGTKSTQFKVLASGPAPLTQSEFDSLVKKWMGK